MPLLRRLKEVIKRHLKRTQDFDEPQTSIQSTQTAVTSSILALNSPTSNDVTLDGSCWKVHGVGTFDKRSVYTFMGNSLPHGLCASDYTVRDTEGNENAIFDHHFTPRNARVHGGFLNLVVPGCQDVCNGPLQCAEVVTTESKICYASVRTRAIMSSVAGTCHGAFFYQGDNQEVDIEYLTDATSLSNSSTGQPVPLWYTNQAVKVGGQGTSQAVVALTDGKTADLSAVVHEYRIDWTPKWTAFYFDGQLQTRFKTNIPSQPGPWVWNNWANGDQGWSAGPPAQDSVFRIQRIEMYYNTSSS